MKAAPKAAIEIPAMRQDVLDGLCRQPKQLPCKYFYDEWGSFLFDRICELPEYYLTRTELGILRRHAAEIATCLGEDCLLIEYGSGSSLKTRVLLDALASPAGYVPIDISAAHLARAAARLGSAYPGLDVMPVCADYGNGLRIPSSRRPARRRIGFHPGSTLGNLEPGQATAFLRRLARTTGDDGGLLIGLDLVKDAAILHAAYDDAAGVTAAFNLNLLRRLNRELAADFHLGRFRHRARWNAGAQRMEMHLESVGAQTAVVAGAAIDFAAGETIHTENSHKYRLEDIPTLAAAAGLRAERIWQDPRGWFAVCYLVPARRQPDTASASPQGTGAAR